MKTKAVDLSGSSPSSSGSLPSLSSLNSLYGARVLKDYNMLEGGLRGMYRRLYVAVFNYLNPLSKLNDLVFLYAVPGVLKDFDNLFTIREFLFMCKIWYYSNGGKKTIDSRNFKTTPHERQFIANFIKLGFVFRSSFVPSSPYLIKNRCVQHVFITFKPEGIKYYNSIVDEVYKRVKYDMYFSSIIDDEE